MAIYVGTDKFEKIEDIKGVPGASRIKRKLSGKEIKESDVKKASSKPVSKIDEKVQEFKMSGGADVTELSKDERAFALRKAVTERAKKKSRDKAKVEQYKQVERMERTQTNREVIKSIEGKSYDVARQILAREAYKRREGNLYYVEKQYPDFQSTSITPREKPKESEILGQIRVADKPTDFNSKVELFGEKIAQKGLRNNNVGMGITGKVVQSGGQFARGFDEVVSDPVQVGGALALGAVLAVNPVTSVPGTIILAGAVDYAITKQLIDIGKGRPTAEVLGETTAFVGVAEMGGAIGKPYKQPVKNFYDEIKLELKELEFIKKPKPQWGTPLGKKAEIGGRSAKERSGKTSKIELRKQSYNQLRNQLRGTTEGFNLKDIAKNDPRFPKYKGIPEKGIKVSEVVGNKQVSISGESDLIGTLESMRKGQDPSPKVNLKDGLKGIRIKSKTGTLTSLNTGESFTGQRFKGKTSSSGLPKDIVSFKDAVNMKIGKIRTGTEVRTGRQVFKTESLFEISQPKTKTLKMDIDIPKANRQQMPNFISESIQGNSKSFNMQLLNERASSRQIYDVSQYQQPPQKIKGFRSGTYEKLSQRINLMKEQSINRQILRELPGIESDLPKIQTKSKLFSSDFLMPSKPKSDMINFMAEAQAERSMILPLFDMSSKMDNMFKSERMIESVSASMVGTTQERKPVLISAQAQQLSTVQASTFDFAVPIIIEQKTIPTKTTTPKKPTPYIPIIDNIQINPPPPPPQKQEPQSPPPPEPPPTKIILPPMPPLFGLPQREGQKGAIQRYDVFVKSGNRKIKVNKNQLSRENALSLGARIVDNTTSRRFELKQAGKTRQRKNERTDNYFSNKNYKFRPLITQGRGKINPYIEKSTYAIDSQGEFKGITVEGWLAKKRKKKSKR